MKLIKPTRDEDFEEIKVTTKNWNLEIRRKVNGFLTSAYNKEDSTTEFDAYCEIIDIATTLTEKEVFNLSTDEIRIIGQEILVEINKKK